MSAFESVLGPLFWTLVGLWVFVSSYVVLERVASDHREDPLRDVRRKIPRYPPPGAELRATWMPFARELSRKALERLVADARTPSWMAQELARDVVSRSGDSALLAAARNKRASRAHDRVEALRVLSRAGHGDALSLLEEAVRDENPVVVGGAVGILGQRKDLASARCLIDCLRRETYFASRVAAQLEDFPLPIAPLLSPLLTDASPVARLWAGTLLGLHREDPLDDRRLAALASDPDARVRKASVVSLVKREAAEAVGVALALLHDPIWYVRAHAARALGHLGHAERAGVLIPLLSDPNWWVRMGVKDALVAIGPAVIPALTAALAHPDRFARNSAAEVLQNLGHLDHLASAAAEARLTAEDREVLEQALGAGEDYLVSALVERTAPPSRAAVQRVIQTFQPPIGIGLMSSSSRTKSTAG